MTDLHKFDNFPVLKTERLLLREVTPIDAQAIITMYGDTETIKFMYDIETPMATDDEAIEIIEWCGDIFRERRGLRWAITLKGDDTLIGRCGYHYWLPNHRRAEIGYDLARHYWRQGIMTEAVRAMLHFGFDSMNLYRIEADVTVGNLASAALLKKLHFKQEGLWRQRVFARDKFWDLWQFGLLKDEYRIE